MRKSSGYQNLLVLIISNRGYQILTIGAFPGNDIGVFLYQSGNAIMKNVNICLLLVPWMNSKKKQVHVLMTSISLGLMKSLGLVQNVKEPCTEFPMYWTCGLIPDH